MRRQGKVNGLPVKLEKTVSLYARQSIVNFTYETHQPGEKQLDSGFGPEFNFSLLAGRAPDRYYEIAGAGSRRQLRWPATGRSENVKSCENH